MERKEFSKDMKDIYGAPNREASSHALYVLDKNWNSKYSYFFTYSGDIVPVIPEDMVPLFHDVNRVKLIKNLSF